LVDTDPQRSALGWARLRRERAEAHALDVFDVTLSRLPALLDAAERDGVDFAIVDTPPHSTVDAALALRLATYVLVPVRPTVLDLMALEATQQLIRSASRPASVVLSACPSRAPENEDAAPIIADMGFELAPVRIAERR